MSSPRLIRIAKLTKTITDTVSLFSSLRFLPYGYRSKLHLQKPADDSPYEIFYNLYKPSTAFKKTAPPEPDFSVVVIEYVVLLFLALSTG